MLLLQVVFLVCVIFYAIVVKTPPVCVVNGFCGKFGKRKVPYWFEFQLSVIDTVGL